MWEQQTLLSEDRLVSPSLSQASEKDSQELPDSCSNTFERYATSVHVGLSGRTSQERSQASRGRLTASSCPKWMRSGMVWHGEYWMRSFSACPNDASVCSLLEVLEPCVARKYFLSAKACRGIISRADRRGKALTDEAQERFGEADHDSGRLTPGETQSRRVYPTSGVYPTLSTREKSGQNQESVFTQFGDDIAGTLTARYDSSPCVDRGANVVVDDRQKVFLCQTAQTGSNGKLVKQNDVMNTLDRTNSTAVAALDFNPTDARLRHAHDDVSQTLTARAGTGGNQVPLVQVQPIVFNPNAGINEQGGGFAVSEDVTNHPDVSNTLTSHMGTGGNNVPLVKAFKWNQGERSRSLAIGDVSPTLTTDHNPAVYEIAGNTEDSHMDGLTVRRLTPLECERLQGFPDGWTDIPWRGRERAPDGPRYKALGNSMAVPVMRWIGECIQMVEETDETTD